MRLRALGALTIDAQAPGIWRAIPNGLAADPREYAFELLRRQPTLLRPFEG